MPVRTRQSCFLLVRIGIMGRERPMIPVIAKRPIDFVLRGRTTAHVSTNRTQKRREYMLWNDWLLAFCVSKKGITEDIAAQPNHLASKLIAWQTPIISPSCLSRIRKVPSFKVNTMKVLLFRILFLGLSLLFDGAQSVQQNCNGVCYQYFPESCPTVIKNYRFLSGTCCSLADNSTTGGCDLTVTSSDGHGTCDYVSANVTCSSSAVIGCNNQDISLISTAADPCPASSYKNVVTATTPAPTPAGGFKPIGSFPHGGIPTFAPPTLTPTQGASATKLPTHSSSPQVYMSLMQWSGILVGGSMLLFLGY